jgi:hypothetical protein
MAYNEALCFYWDAIFYVHWVLIKHLLSAYEENSHSAPLRHGNNGQLLVMMDLLTGKKHCPSNVNSINNSCGLNMGSTYS